MSIFALMTAQVGQAQCFVICVLGAKDFSEPWQTAHTQFDWN